MKEMFTKTLVVCAAASVFGGSAFLGDQVLTSYIHSKSVAAQNLAASESGESGSPTPLATADIPKPKASLSFSFGK